jgi:LysM domain
MTSPKDYTGLRVVEHVVKRGETFEKIAGIYLLSTWRPIMNYNTEVYPVLKSRNPKLLPAGKRILIPRSRVGYDRWAKALKQLVLSLEGFNYREAVELDALQDEANAQYVLWDLAGDIATAFGSLGAKGYSAAKSAALAYDAELAEEPLMDALRFCWNETEEYAGSVEDFFTKVIGAAQKSVRNAGLEKLFDKVSGRNVALLRKLLKAGMKASKNGVTIKSAAEGIADATRAGFEFFDVLKVSFWNKKLLLLYTGQTLEGTVAEQRRRIEKTLGSQMDTLTEKIKRIEEEKQIVWGAH